MINNALKWTLILVPVAIGGVLVFVYMKKSKLLATTTPGTPNYTGTNNGVINTTSPVVCHFPMVNGTSNSCVRTLQQAFLAVHSNALPKYGADGIFGDETASELVKWTGKRQLDSQADYDNLINYIYGN